MGWNFNYFEGDFPREGHNMPPNPGIFAGLPPRHRKGYVAPGIHQVAQRTPAASAASHYAESVERVLRKNIEITTPVGRRRMSVMAALGEQALEYAEIMARSEATQGVSLGLVHDHVASLAKRKWWKENVKRLGDPIKGDAILHQFQANIRPHMEEIIKLSNKWGYAPVLEQHQIAGMDDIINVLQFKRSGRSSIPMIVPTTGGRYAFEKTAHGYAGLILQDYIPAGGQRLNYMQAVADALREANTANLRRSTGRKSFSTILKDIQKKFEPIRVAAKFGPEDLPHMQMAWDPDLERKLGKFYDKLYSTPGMDIEGAFQEVSEAYGGHVTPGYSTAYLKPEAFLSGKLSSIRPADMPFGQYLSLSKPSYQRFTRTPLFAPLAKGFAAPVMSVETAFTLDKWLPMFKKGRTSEHWVKSLVVTDPYAWQTFASSAETAVVSDRLKYALTNAGKTSADDLTMLIGGRKASMLTTAPAKMLGGYDLITGQMPMVDEFLRGMVGAGAAESMQRGGRGGALKFVRRLTKALPGTFRLTKESNARVLMDMQETLEFKDLYDKISGVYQEMGLSLPAGGPTNVKGLEGRALGMYLPVAPRALRVEDLASDAMRKFRAQVEWRHLMLQDQPELAEFMMKKAEQRFHAFPEFLKTLAPFAGRGDVVGRTAGDALMKASALTDEHALDWLLSRDLTAASAPGAGTPFFKRVWEKGLTVELPRETSLFVGAMEKGGEAISARSKYFHLPALRSFSKEIGLVASPELMAGIPMAAHIAVHKTPLLKSVLQAYEAARQWGAGAGTRSVFQQRYEALGQMLAAEGHRDGLLRDLAEPVIQNTLYGQIKGAPGATSIALFQQLGSRAAKKGVVTPGIGEIVMGKADIKRLGLTLEQVQAGEAYAIGQAYPGIGPSTTMPMKIRYQRGLKKGMFTTHAADRLMGFRDLDRDAIALFSDPNADFHKYVRQWHLSDVRNKRRVYGMFMRHLKDEGDRVAGMSAAELMADAAKKAGMGGGDLTALVQATYSTKLLTGPVNAQLAPLRMMAIDVFGQNAQQAQMVSETLGFIEQAVGIQKGSSTGRQLFDELMAVSASSEEAATVANMERLLGRVAEDVHKMGPDTGKGFLAYELRNSATYRATAAEALFSLRKASLDPKYSTQWNLWTQAFSGRSAPSLGRLMETFNRYPREEQTKVIQSVNRFLGYKGRGAMMTADPTNLMSEMNEALLREGSEGAAKTIFGTAKQLWTSLPSWGKIGAVGLAAVGGLAAYRGLTADAGPPSGMTIPPEVVMKELYGAHQIGAPVPPSTIQAPQHEFSPTIAHDMKPPARLRATGRHYDVRLNARDNAFIDPAAMSGEFEKLMRQHTGAAPHIRSFVTGPRDPDSRLAAMRRFGDIRESRFYA